MPRRSNMRYVYSDVSPFLEENITGDINVLYDADVVFRSLRNIMSTISGERVRNPIGSTLVGFLFRPVSDDVAEMIVDELKRVIREYEPRITNLRITARPYPDRMMYDIQLRFGILGLDGSQVMNAPLRSFVE